MIDALERFGSAVDRQPSEDNTSVYLQLCDAVEHRRPQRWISRAVTEILSNLNGRSGVELDFDDEIDLEIRQQLSKIILDELMPDDTAEKTKVQDEIDRAWEQEYDL